MYGEQIELRVYRVVFGRRAQKRRPQNRHKLMNAQFVVIYFLAPFSLWSSYFFAIMTKKKKKRKCVWGGGTCTHTMTFKA